MNSIVSLIKSKANVYEDLDIDYLVREAIDKLGGISKFIKPGQRVMIKPNLVVAKKVNQGVTTDPQVVKALIKIIKEGGVSDILIGDSSSVGINTQRVMEKTGMLEVAREMNVETVCFEQASFKKINFPQGKFLTSMLLPDSVLNADVIINVPKAKTHYLDSITCCVKNWVSLIPQGQRLKYHKNELSQVVADILNQIHPTLSVVDALIVGEGEGPISNTPRFLGCILAGKDPVATDVVTGELLGFDALQLEYPWMAHLQGLGEINLDKIKIIGSCLDKIKIKIRPAGRAFDEGFPCNTILGGSCPGCEVFVRTAIENWLQEGAWEELFQNKTPTFMLGYNAQDLHFEKHIQEGPYFVIGDCASSNYKEDKRVVFISGCSPGPNVSEEIEKVRGLKRAKRQS